MYFSSLNCFLDILTFVIFYSTLQPHHTIYILWRRYALTVTSPKYLEIGIKVGPVPTVEIIFSSNYENQLIVTVKTWKKLMRKSVNIQQLARADKSSLCCNFARCMVPNLSNLHII